MTSALGPHDLVLSHFSLPLTTPFPERVAAAAEAGFAGIGWYVVDYVRHLEQGWTDAQLRRVLDEHGLVLHEVDALPLDRLGLLDQAVHLGITFGAHHVQVQGNRPGSVDEAAATIAGIADRLAPHAIEVAIEFVASNNIATAADALELVERAGRDNVGVQVDVWHHVRGANDWTMVERIPLDRIASVQLDDGPLEPAHPDYLYETVHHRFPPGEGAFDLARFLRTVHPAGSTLPLSLEVIDDDLLALPPAQAARRIGDATRSLLAELGS